MNPGALGIRGCTLSKILADSSVNDNAAGTGMFPPRVFSEIRRNQNVVAVRYYGYACKTMLSIVGDPTRFQCVSIYAMAAAP